MSASSLVSSVFLEAASAIYWTALRWLERDFSFSAAVRTSDLVHGSAAVSSFSAHVPLTPLYRLVTQQILPKSSTRAYWTIRDLMSVHKVILARPRLNLTVQGPSFSKQMPTIRLFPKKRRFLNQNREDYITGCPWVQ
jgi:hypothetical protein